VLVDREALARALEREVASARGGDGEGALGLGLAVERRAGGDGAGLPELEGGHGRWGRGGKVEVLAGLLLLGGLHLEIQVYSAPAFTHVGATEECSGLTGEGVMSFAEGDRELIAAVYLCAITLLARECSPQLQTCPAAHSDVMLTRVFHLSTLALTD
jgi:hypothetical protein